MLAFLTSIYPVTNALQTKLIGIVKHLKVAKWDYVLRAGEVCKNIYFVKSGLLRCYYDKDGHEVSAWFMRENDTLVSVDSFYDQIPGDENIQALEDCDLYYISFYELELVFNSFMEFNYIGRVLTLKYLRIWTRDLRNIRLMTAEERYQDLLKRDPDLIRRVLSKYIASYLGMSEATLSRNRKASSKKPRRRRR